MGGLLGSDMVDGKVTGTITGQVVEINGKHMAIATSSDGYGDIAFWVGEVGCVDDFEPIKNWDQAYAIAKRLAEAS